jgi:D-glycero-alpha-D-manno-heptose-7-phosphate kinase
VSPFLEERGGVVLSATVDKYSYATLKTCDSGTVTVRSLDYDVVAKYMLDQPLPLDGDLKLINGVLKRLNGAIPAGQGFEVSVHTDAPPGSGLGGSSALVVAVIGAFQSWCHLPLTVYDIANLAYQIERNDLGLTGGKQDQFAAAFGGVNFIEFSRDGTIVNPLRIAPDTLNELQYNLLLCYSGESRSSDPIIKAQIQNYVSGDVEATAAMEALKALTYDMKRALLVGDLMQFGELLGHAWQAKRRMAAAVSNPRLDKIYATAIEAGAIGGKISGAGGGGYMYFYCPFPTKHRVALALEGLSVQIVPFSFSLDGLQTWQVK